MNIRIFNQLVLFLSFALISTGALAQCCINKTKADSVYITVEQMPQYPDGESEMLNYIISNLSVSNSVEEEGIITRATVRFVVTKTGQIKGVRAIGKNKDTNFAKDLIKLVEKMPRWTAGKHKGKNVDVYYTLPINIKVRESLPIGIK